MASNYVCLSFFPIQKYNIIPKIFPKKTTKAHKIFQLESFWELKILTKHHNHINVRPDPTMPKKAKNKKVKTTVDNSIKFSLDVKINCIFVMNTDNRIPEGRRGETSSLNSMSQINIRSHNLFPALIASGFHSPSFSQRFTVSALPNDEAHHSPKPKPFFEPRGKNTLVLFL